MDLRRLQLQYQQCPYEDIFDRDRLSQVIGYEDESVEIYFKDRSNLQLSPCGANFRYTRPHSGVIPSLGRRQFEVTQRCVFATSETREKVLTGLLIRNQLCSQPYLAAEFLSDMHLEPIHGYKELVRIEWPHTPDAVSVNIDGSITVCSLKGEAVLQLYPCNHAVVVHYNICIQDYDIHSKGNATKTVNSNRLWCVVQKRVFPVSLCPPEWMYPLSLAQNVPSVLSIDLSNVPSNFEHMLPKSAPRRCPNQFRHLWRDIECTFNHPDIAQIEGVPEVADTSIKFVWCEDNLYWMHSDGVFPKIETWLRNGDILKSHPKNERYFIHLQSSKSSKDEKAKYIERIMSSAFIPSDVVMKGVTLRCIRMISYKYQHNASVKGINPCRESAIGSDAKVRLIPNLKANVNIPMLGTFSAVADSIEISFNDGTMVHMNLAFSNPEHANSKLSCRKCRIVLSDGQYFLVEDLNCPPLCAQNYVIHVLAWVQWLSLPNSARIDKPFYSGTIYDQSEMRRVQKELNKIGKATSSLEAGRNLDNFQYLELSGTHPIPTPCRKISMNEVTEALSHTSKAIDDIDTMISQFKKLK